LKSTPSSLWCQNEDYNDHNIKGNNNNNSHKNNDNKNNKPSKMEQATTLLNCFQEGTCLNVARDTSCFGAFSDFTQFLHTISGTVLEVDPQAFFSPYFFNSFLLQPIIQRYIF
jgi:hypothetical protein